MSQDTEKPSTGRPAGVPGADDRAVVRRLRSILDAMAEAVIVADANGRLVEFNKAAERLHGIGLSDEGPERWAAHYRIFLPDGVTPCPTDQVPLLRTLRGERVDRAEMLVRRPDGHGTLVEVTGRPLLEDGRVAGAIIVADDVSDRTRAELALRERETELEEAQRLAKLGSWEWTVETGAVQWSSELFRIFDRRPEDSQAYADHLRLFTPESAARLDAAVREAVRSGTPYELDLELVGGGVVRHVTARGEARRDPSGRIVGLRGTVQDSTERVQAEAALKRSEARYRTLAESARDAIFIIDRDLRVQYVNRFGAAMIGSPAADIVGKTIHDVFPRPLADSYTASLQQVLASGEPYYRETRGGAAERDVTLGTQLVPLVSEQGEITGIIGVARDITQRVASDNALRRRDAVLSAVSLAAEKFLHTGGWRDTIEEVLGELGEATGVSRVVIFEARHGADDEVFITRRHEWRAPGIDARPDEALRDLPLRRQGFGRWVTLLKQGCAIFERVRALPPPEQDGLLDQGILSVAVVPISVEGELWGFIGFDVCAAERDWDEPETEALSTAARILGEAIARERAETARARLEDQLRQSQKMEAVGRLAGGVAHDFNNLLTTILGYSELLLDGLAAGDPRRNGVAEIVRASRSATVLTQRLLVFSRKQVLKPEVLDLNAVVGNLEGMLRRLIGEDLEFTVQLGARPANIHADRVQVEQVVMNLAVNARDAMPRGGRLTIATADRRISAADAIRDPSAASGDFVVLSISDTGHGMTPEVKARIFEPFFTTKDPGKGTGLGLSTVYGIVRQSEGHIRVESEPAHGTRFDVLFPRVAASATVSPAGRLGTAPRGTERILLVEDNEQLRDLAHQTLERSGYTVLSASDGATALAITAGLVDPIELLVTDVVMPGMSGRQLAEQLLATRSTLRVLYMSGYTDDAILHHGVSTAGIAFLPKPFTPSELAKKVRDVLDQPTGDR